MFARAITPNDIRHDMAKAKLSAASSSFATNPAAPASNGTELTPIKEVIHKKNLIEYESRHQGQVYVPKKGGKAGDKVDQRYGQSQSGNFLHSLSNDEMAKEKQVQ
jgi:hypothetical protein